MAHLCKQLGTEKKELDKICGSIDKYYREDDKLIRGKKRHIAEPRGRLRQILNKLNDFLQRIALPDTIQGGRRGFSYITNASQHTRKPMLLPMDLKDFFPNVSPHQVYSVFNNRLGCSPDVARYLTMLTTYKGSLPQGSPTSTIVAALVIESMANRLESLAEKHNATYTQYVDDITMSGPAHISRLVRLIERMIRQEGFWINPDKTKPRDRHEEQVVTGLRVNQGLDARGEKIREVRRLVDGVEERCKLGDKLSDSELASLKGKIGHIRQFNRGAGRYLQRRLNRVLTNLSPSQTPATG